MCLSPPRLAGREVRLRDIRIDFDAVSGFVPNSVIPVLEDWTVVDHEVLPPVDVLRELMNAEVAHGRGCVCRRDRPYRTRGVVRRGSDVIVIGQVVDALGFQQSADFGISRWTCRNLAVRSAAETVARVQILARRNRDVHGLRHARHSIRIAGRDGILQPHRFDGFETFARSIASRTS